MKRLMVIAALLLFGAVACGGDDFETTVVTVNTSGDMQRIWDSQHRGEPSVYRYHDTQKGVYCWLTYAGDSIFCMPEDLVR